MVGLCLLPGLMHPAQLITHAQLNHSVYIPRRNRLEKLITEMHYTDCERTAILQSGVMHLSPPLQPMVTPTGYLQRQGNLDMQPSLHVCPSVLYWNSEKHIAFHPVEVRGYIEKSRLRVGGGSLWQCYTKAVRVWIARNRGV